MTVLSLWQLSYVILIIYDPTWRVNILLNVVVEMLLNVSWPINKYHLILVGDTITPLKSQIPMIAYM